MLNLLLDILFVILIAAAVFFSVEGLIMLQDAYLRISKLKQAHLLSLQTRKPVLNISCGPTDYGHVNADIFPRDHEGFVLYDKDKPLPFKDKEFAAAFSTHTLEHVDNVEEFLNELNRVADEIFLVYPLVDFTFWNPNHKWIFFSRNPKHYVKNPFYHPRYSKKAVIETDNFLIKRYWNKKIKPELIKKAKELGVEPKHPLI
jgi:SAM-dependent methyltransferase